MAKFKGIFNWYGEDYILYTHAPNKITAKLNFIHQLTKKIDKPRSQIKMHFSGQIDNYYIEQIK